ncbi:hypothetical protein QUB68_13685 [Microcoleus sp. A006_D1]|uniref:hypothetical protein n=1 Tax=Microcoleus sp. A006_D1 TaxID=3055267 RepID=UPI002FD037B3
MNCWQTAQAVRGAHPTFPIFLRVLSVFAVRSKKSRWAFYQEQICRFTGFPNCCGVGFEDKAVRYTLPTLDSTICDAQNHLKGPVGKLSTQRPRNTVHLCRDRPTNITAQNACTVRVEA